MTTVKDILNENLDITGEYYDEDGQDIGGIDEATQKIEEYMIAFATYMMNKIADIPGAHEASQDYLREWESISERKTY